MLHRILCAINCLRGRPTAYRVNITHADGLRMDASLCVECSVRQDKTSFGFRIPEGTSIVPCGNQKATAFLNCIQEFNAAK